MDILKNLTNMMGGHSSAGYRNPGNSNQNYSSGAGAGAGGGLSELLNPAVLGGLASALFPSGRLGGATGQSSGAGLGGLGSLGSLGGLLGGLMSSGALSDLFGKGEQGASASGMANTGRSTPASANTEYGNSGYSGAGMSNPGFSTDNPVQIPASSPDRAVRMLRAMIYAAKADGHIDATEQASINQQVQSLNLGQQARDLLKQYMNEPLDPAMIARGVTDAGEAAQLYGLSCAITDMDNFMERSYLDGLANALGLSPQMRNAIESQVHRG